MIFLSINIRKIGLTIKIWAYGDLKNKLHVIDINN